MASVYSDEELVVQRRLFVCVRDGGAIGCDGPSPPEGRAAAQVACEPTAGISVRGGECIQRAAH